MLGASRGSLLCFWETFVRDREREGVESTVNGMLSCRDCTSCYQTLKQTILMNIWSRPQCLREFDT